MKNDRPQPLNLKTHFDALRRWLDLEGAAETARLMERCRIRDSEKAERSGESLLNLMISDTSSGLGGRVLLTLRRRTPDEPLPWNRFRPGSPVILSATDENGHGQRPHSAIVSRRRPDCLEVAMDYIPDGRTFRIDLSPDDVTRKRQLASLDQIENAQGRCRRLRDILLYQETPQFRERALPEALAGHLNESQADAVRFAFCAEDVAVIHGPPGTGKTTTVVEIIRQAVASGETVLATAPSNTAVDNLLERLLALKVPVLRLGHPARVMEHLRHATLDLLAEKHEFAEIAADLRSEARSLKERAQAYRRKNPGRDLRRELREEAKDLQRQARALEQQVIRELLEDHPVICATTSHDFTAVEHLRFDLLVIDEACQSIEPGCWVPIPLANRLLLAGDHCQLPPTILSKDAAQAGLAVSLMERIVNAYADEVTKLLTVQYRMNSQIMEFSSDRFYGGRLTAHADAAERTLCDFPNYQEELCSPSVLEFFDTAGAGWDEVIEEDSLSKYNPQEAKLVITRLQELQEAGVGGRKIAVIAPYAAQVRLLRDQCDQPRVEIDTVDGFQGREKDVVIISLVRSNRECEIGFLGDARRMNVAITRARRKLIIIGDSATVGGDDFFADLLNWFESHQAVKSVWEIMDPTA